MANLENLNWKLKEQALITSHRALKNMDCELGGATLMSTNESPEKPSAELNPKPQLKAQPTPRPNQRFAPRPKYNPYLPGNLEVNEPDPTLPSLNPFAQARNLSRRRQAEIAEDLGLEVVDVIRLEQGILTDVPEDIVKYYMEELKLPEGWLAGYRLFQGYIRRAAPRPIYGVWRFPPGEVNFRRWRNFNWPTLSQMGFCKAFCIHPSALYSIERDAARTSVPYIILQALIQGNIMSEDQAKHFAYRIRQASQAARMRAPHKLEDE